MFCGDSLGGRSLALVRVSFLVAFPLSNWEPIFMMPPFYAVFLLRLVDSLSALLPFLSMVLEREPFDVLDLIESPPNLS